MSETDRFDHKNFLKTISTRPGVYRMLNAESEVIYVGKASNLKKRVSSYFRERPGSAKTAAMMKQVARVEVTILEPQADGCGRRSSRWWHWPSLSVPCWPVWWCGRG